MKALQAEKVTGGWNVLLLFPGARDEMNKPITMHKFLPEIMPRKMWHGYETPLDMSVISHGNIVIQPQTRSMPKFDNDYAENSLRMWRKTGEQYTRIGQKQATFANGKPVFMRLALAKGHSIPEQKHPIEYIFDGSAGKYIPKCVYHLLGKNSMIERESIVEVA